MVRYSMNEQKVFQDFPLHYHVWKNDNAKLEELLSERKHGLETKDPYGRTPLMLAVKLNREACAISLITFGAQVFDVYRKHWSLEQETVSSANFQLLRSVLTKHNAQNKTHFFALANQTLSQLAQAPDFYFEMKFDFSTWLPTVAAIHPSELCRFWKRGSSLRVDANLVSYVGSSPSILGAMSYIFSNNEKGELFLHEINHSTRAIFAHRLVDTKANGPSSASGADSNDKESLQNLVSKKLSLPSFTTYVANKHLEYSRSSSGAFPWSSVRKEQVNKRLCCVHHAKDVQVTTMKRFEHLEQNLGSNQDPFNPNNLSLEQYFTANKDVNPSTLEIGRTKSIVMKVKTFKTLLWMSEDLDEEMCKNVHRVVTLMSDLKPIFKRLNYFLDSKLPQGFPVKIEMPFFEVLYGSVTFGNFNGEDGAARGVVISQSEMSGSGESTGSSTKPLLSSSGSTCPKCTIDESMFAIPQNYLLKNEDLISHYGTPLERELDIENAMMLLLEEFGRAESLVNRQYSLTNHKVAQKDCAQFNDEDDAMIQDAIAASLDSVKKGNGELPAGLSEEDRKKVMESRERQEEEELAKAIELSKTFK